MKAIRVICSRIHIIFDLSLDLNEGVFSIIEAGYNHNFLKGFKGVIKLGASLHSGNHMHSD